MWLCTPFLPSSRSSTISKKNSMVTSLSSSMPKLHCSMEWKAIQKKIGYLVLWLLVLSTIFLLFILQYSNPLTMQGLSQSPTINTDNKSVTQLAQIPLPKLSSPPPTTNEGHHQSPSLTGNYDNSMKPAIKSSPPNPSSRPTMDKAGLSPSPPLPASKVAMAPVFQNPSSELSSSPTLANGMEELCDMSKGKWVKEPRGSVYTNMTCPTLPETKNCVKYGKKQNYLYWRWQPDGCELPRFEPMMFLNIVQGKKLAFIGDSLARNQMESLLCLLSQAETPAEIYKDSEDKYRTWYFPSHNFTLLVMWTEFFALGIPRIVNGTATGSFDVHLDQINRNWADKLPGVDYAVISGGNWFFRKNYVHKGGKIIGCVNCQEGNLTNHGVHFAIRMTLRAALEFISTCKECQGLVTFVRTYTPAHFEGGSWFTGGHCNRTRPLNDSEVSLDMIPWELRNIQLEELERIKQREMVGKRKFGLLDVTKAMMFRADGHPGSNWDKRWTTANDCLHWCLPGPVDMLNDLLLQILKKELVAL
ncbi:xyloglucan O-acetyltransferase 3 [Elaeis guineensis]|uniref:Protein ALTERED XYLOGLUCAN 4-like n=1 Tax=Elaeis guineensis var. tenera TaxID=51953 RepID=A0A6I9QUH7_ELAGV|nr:protein ALTERED XYLOGLUCAN 4-like [Elaeis guineensis]